MTRGSLIFVHGTGVRLNKDYLRSIDNAKKAAEAAGISQVFVECAWGDQLGVEFEGKSLPDPPSVEKIEDEEEDFARWSWLFDAPLFELAQLTIRDPQAPSPMLNPGEKPNWEKLWEKIAAYQPTEELRLLLNRGSLLEFWQDAWSQTIEVSPIPRQAFEASAHELPEASHALARALVAQLHVSAVNSGISAPSRKLRSSLFERLVADWKQTVFAPPVFFSKFLRRAATRILQRHRESFSNTAVLLIGDILLYQVHGCEIRKFIRHKIENAEPPITLVAHSLGGIACVDLLALENPPRVDHLVTVGSQSPLLYEIGALYSLKPPQPLPMTFPPWLNLYDRNDFLSYVAGRLWPEVKDFEIESGNPFPDSHCAYFGNDMTWYAIHQFIANE